MKVVTYTRVSTAVQDVDAQRRDLVGFIQARGWDLVAEYTDKGISGARQSRPQLDKLMADARKRRMDAVVVWRFDRFGRSLRHLINALEEFRSLGIQFISMNDGIDTSTPTGNLMFGIVSSISEFERSLIRERIRMGLRNARANGIRLGRPTVDVPVDEVRRLRQDGLSIRAIAKRLGIPKSRVETSLRAS